jgi:hypothetical protein
MTSREADIVERLRAYVSDRLPGDIPPGPMQVVERADLTTAADLIERLSQENEGLRTAQQTNAKLANTLMEMAARLSVNSPLGWCRPDCVTLQDAAQRLRGEPDRIPPENVGAVLSASLPLSEEENEAVTVVVEEIGGNCPVQAEGTIDGRRFYFRARWNGWRVAIHPTATGDYLSWPDDGTEWDFSEAWGEGEYDAGWMPEDTAREMIDKAANLYRAAAPVPVQTEK